MPAKKLPTILTVLVISLGLVATYAFVPVTKTYAVLEGITGKATVMNTGAYLDFDNYESNVQVDDITGNFSGYAWLEDFGWVDFGTTDNTEGPVQMNLDTGAVIGKAKVLSTGAYLDFNASPYASDVTMTLSTGTLSGYVWSEDAGWIDFQNAEVPVIAENPFYNDIDEDDSGTDLNLKITGLVGVNVRDATEEVDPNTKNSDKEIKVITTNRNRPSITFGLIDEDDNNVDIAKYDIQIQFTDTLGRRIDSYKTWVKGIEHQTPEKSKTLYKDGFKIRYTGEDKNRVEVQPVTKELKDGTYYVRLKVYDKAGNTVTSKEVKLIITSSYLGDSEPGSGNLAITALGAIPYDSKYSYYYYNSNLITIKGTASSNSQIDLYQGDTRLNKVTAGSDGSFTINYNLENGIYNLKMVQGETSIAFTLNIDNTSQSFPANILTGM